NRIARLNADGTVDPSFGFSGGINNTPLALALQKDGRIIVGGQFSQVDLVQRFNLARLNSDGTVDLTFNPGNGSNGDVNAIAIQPDGRIVIGGTFIAYNGFARGGAARVLSDGSLDPTFDSGVGTGGNVFALALQANGHIVVGGIFTSCNGVNRANIARLFAGADALQNISARAHVFTGERVLIGGFIIDGAQNKTVLLRGIGPSLASFGIMMPLADPVLELHGHSGALVLSNDNWQDTQRSQIIETGRAPTNDLESALIATLAPGAYTAIVRGKGMMTGTALVEIFDIDQNANAEITNLSARGFVGTGNDVMIGGGVVVSGN